MSRTDKDTAKQEVLSEEQQQESRAQQMRHLYEPSLIHSRAHVRKHMIADSRSRLALASECASKYICHILLGKCTSF